MRRELKLDYILNHLKEEVIVFLLDQNHSPSHAVGIDGRKEKNNFVIPESLIITNFRPFEDLLPQNYVNDCIQAMTPYIDEANITVSLNDDTYKFACTLPGRIAHSNADSTANDTLWWSFGTQDFLNDDYVIKAASVVYYETKIQRVVVASALVILLVLIFLSKKRKQS